MGVNEGPAVLCSIKWNSKKRAKSLDLREFTGVTSRHVLLFIDGFQYRIAFETPGLSGFS